MGEVIIGCQVHQSVHRGVPGIDPNIFAMHMIDAAFFTQLFHHCGGFHA